MRFGPKGFTFAFLCKMGPKITFPAIKQGPAAAAQLIE